MEGEIRVRVFWDPCRASQNARLHWRARANLNRQARAAAVIGWRMAGSPTMDVPAKVTLIVRRGRRVDSENALSGCKSVTDLLTDRKRSVFGVLMDDSPDWLEWESIQQEVGKQWATRPEVEYVFRPREAAEDQS